VNSELNDDKFAEEFADLSVDGISRRRFLSLVSASAALAFGASCSRIDRGAIVSYTKRPDRIIPGVEDYYASTFQEGLVTYGVLVKTREGRPIHVEGNSEHLFSRGKTSLRSIGDLLGLYDPDRLRAPSRKGTPVAWGDAEKAISSALSDARIMEKPILFLTNAVVSPAQKALIYDLRLALPGFHHAAWEPNLPHSQIFASRMMFGETALPRFHFERAQLILSLQSDFLGTDSAAAAYAQAFSTHRSPANPSDNVNRLWVVEGSMTLTGANADQRLRLMPSQIPRFAFTLVRVLNESHSISLPKGLTADDLKPFAPELMSRVGIGMATVKRLAEDLAKAGKSSLVLAGDAVEPETHVACTLLNRMLGAEGNTVEMSTTPSSPGLLNNAELEKLLKEAAQGKFALGIFWGANPGYSFPNASLWKQAVSKIPETYRIGLYEDETALDCEWRLPEHHWLESWGDFESASDFVGLRQPTIGAIHDTRQAEDLLLSCLRQMKMPAARSYLEYLKTRWQADVFPIGSPASFETFWNASLSSGGAKRERQPDPSLVMNFEEVKKAILAASKPPAQYPAGQGFESHLLELVLSPAVGVFDGRYANNGWFNELPDPVTKATWGNPILISMADADEFGMYMDGPNAGKNVLREQLVVEISTDVGKIEAPVIIQPGQAYGVASMALGYGRQTGAVAAGIGANAYRLIEPSSNSPFLIQSVRVKLKKNGEERAIPKTQVYSRMEGRDLARSWTLAEYSRKSQKKKEREQISLIPDQKFPGHKWGMVVDLSACVGCSACEIACQSENNIPVVGPERVLEGRAMHWIRIDRYYEGDLQNPKVLHQPMFCQHCDNAPCEIVCPVNATTHSPDGLNQMAYNRCVGTRYCSNNCPFKVRRFNFFDYTSMKKEPESLVFNPEVTIRPRGVMEKCTLCIQRIQNARQKAKIENRQIVDGEISPACVAACPAGALVFGDLNNAESRVARLSKSDRNYRLLEELGIKPSMSYLADISNPANKG
jgi:Fe-S-cluster-containing dehydrogenase component